jgi:hypothetical protein
MPHKPEIPNYSENEDVRYRHVDSMQTELSYKSLIYHKNTTDGSRKNTNQPDLD